MKIVITGGAGFIGSHIAEYWTGKGAEGPCYGQSENRQKEEYRSS